VRQQAATLGGGRARHPSHGQGSAGAARGRRDNAAMPTHRTPPAPRAASPAAPREPRPTAQAAPLGEAEIDALQRLLDAVPAPLEPLDVSMLDGYLCGVLLQPRPVPPARWLPHVTDVDGRPLPAGFDAGALRALVLRRHAELEDAITRRQWFDPWVFELEMDAEVADTMPGDDGDDGDDEDLDAGDPAASEPVYPWVAGFATAVELFPALMSLDAAALNEPLALIYRHLDPDDLEDADALLETIDSFEPPLDLAESVEGLVRATLLLADVSRPRRSAHTPPRGPGRTPRAASRPHRR